MARFLHWLNSRACFRVLVALITIVFSIVPLVKLAAGRGAKDYKLWFSIGQTVL
jgi:hypothetical protein